MRPLSGLDAGFLYIETPETPMHVGSLTLYESAKSGSAKDSSLTNSPTELVREHMRARLHLAPLLHQRLELMPFDLGHPVWVDVEKVDLNHHVQHRKLAKPGTQAQLESLVAKLHEEALDRSFPLWQFFVIDGLKEGGFALYSKIHHAALDGAAGVVLANAMLDISETPRPVPEPATKQKAKANSQIKLMGVMLSNTFAQYAKIAKALPDAVKQVASSALKGGIVDTVKAGIDLTKNLSWSQTLQSTKELLAPKTPFNVSISAARQFVSLRLPLEEVKAIASTLEASVNDIVMTLCSGALRRYLLAQKQLPKRSLVAAVPVSLRAIDDQAQNNQVTMLPCALGTEQKTPHARLKAARAAMGSIKQNTSKFKSLIPTDYPSFGAPWLVGALAQLYAKTKLADRIALPVNLVISNVPGPKVPLYLAGAKMRAYFPLSIVVHGMALNITVHSYVDSLDFGIVAEAQAIPDLPALAKALQSEHEELKELAAYALLGSKAVRPTKTVKPVKPVKPKPASTAAKATRKKTLKDVENL